MTAAARVFRVGTRGSPLARWQTERVCRRLAEAGHQTEIVEIRTTGDLSPDTPISRLADPALFTRQLDEAMLGDRIDLAVHSLKDLPTDLPVGIMLAAVSEREDPRDALISRDGRGLLQLPQGARIATSSQRRRAQLLMARPDLEIVETRGNVDTRLAKLERDPALAATMLAVAGLTRLGLAHRISERLPLPLMLPAPGQAAMAVTARTDDSVAAQAVRKAIHHSTVAMAVGAERALLNALDGGCEVPVAAYGELVDPGSLAGPGSATVLRLRARVVSLDGQRVVEGQLVQAVSNEADAVTVGMALAERLRLDGAAKILDELKTGAAEGPAC